MESQGLLEIFKRSLDIRNARYLSFIGDGDAKNYKILKDNNPYHPDEIIKYECISHVGERMGAKLRKLTKEKNLGGKGGLLISFIETIQSYFTNAIKKNLTNLEKMKKLFGLFIIIIWQLIQIHVTHIVHQVKTVGVFTTKQ